MKYLYKNRNVVVESSVPLDSAIFEPYTEEKAKKAQEEAKQERPKRATTKRTPAKRTPTRSKKG